MNIVFYKHEYFENNTDNPYVVLPTNWELGRKMFCSNVSE